MPKAQVIRELGPPEIMQWKEWPVPDPQPDEVRVRHTAIGVNFADTYHRSGRHHPWPAPPFPCVLGIEAVGIVEDLGSDVANFEIGQRVCYSRRPLGSYSEVRNYPAENLLHLPEDMRDLDVASSLLKGLTAQYLLTRTYSVQSGDTIVIHAAAGGTGQILCQWAAALGATVIGTVSTPAKAEAARAAGCHIPVVRSEQDFVEIVQDATDGEGAAVVYDSVGKDTFQDSLRCLRTLGVLAVVGHASGPPDPVDVTKDLALRESIFITRPGVTYSIKGRTDLEQSVNSLFEAIRQGIFTPKVNYEIPLKDAAEAHRALENGLTSGATVLLP